MLFLHFKTGVWPPNPLGAPLVRQLTWFILTDRPEAYFSRLAFLDMFGNLGGMDSGNFAEMQQQMQRELLSNPQVCISDHHNQSIINLKII